MNFEAELLQFAGDEIGRAEFLERGFGMSMNIVPPGFHFRLQRDNTIDEGHGDLSAIRAASKEAIGVDIDLQSHIGPAASPGPASPG